MSRQKYVSLRYFRQQPTGRSIDFLKIIRCNVKKFPLVPPNFVPFTRLPKQSPLIHLSMKPTPFSKVSCKCTHICTTNSFVGFVIVPEPPAAVSRTNLTQFRTALAHFHFLLHDGKSRDYADLRKCNCIIKLIRLSMTAVFKRLSTWLLGKVSKRNENTKHGSQDTEMTSRVFHVSWHYHFRVISCISFERKQDYTPMYSSALCLLNIVLKNGWNFMTLVTDTLTLETTPRINMTTVLTSLRFFFLS